MHERAKRRCAAAFTLLLTGLSIPSLAAQTLDDAIDLHAAGNLEEAVRAYRSVAASPQTLPEDAAMARNNACVALNDLNPAPERGMLSSIREGLAAAGGADLLARSGRPLLVTPADLPALRPETVAALLRHGFRDGSTLLVPSYRGRRGHPLIISPARIPEIETLDLAVGLRELLERHPDQVEEIAVEDPGILQDVDTPEDYAAISSNEWI